MLLKLKVVVVSVVKVSRFVVLSVGWFSDFVSLGCSVMNMLVLNFYICIGVRKKVYLNFIRDIVM